MADSLTDTHEHIGKVQARLEEVCNHLTVRAAHHDESKLVDPEKTGYDQLTVRLADVAYGTDEYRAALAEAQPTIAHHYAANSHHPEHYQNGIDDMSLLDVVEMLCDWKAAGFRAFTTGEGKSKYEFSDQLWAILENTVRELGW